MDCQFPPTPQRGSRGQNGPACLEFAMTRTLALYEALVRAKVPQPAARRVVEALESDMNTSLATRQDIELLEQWLAGVDERMLERFPASQGELDLKLAGRESRLLIKLGTLIAALAGLAAAIPRLVG